MVGLSKFGFQQSSCGCGTAEAFNKVEASAMAAGTPEAKMAEEMVAVTLRLARRRLGWYSCCFIHKFSGCLSLPAQHQQLSYSQLLRL